MPFQVVSSSSPSVSPEFLLLLRSLGPGMFLRPFGGRAPVRKCMAGG